MFKKKKQPKPLKVTEDDIIVPAWVHVALTLLLVIISIFVLLYGFFGDRLPYPFN